MSEEIAPQEPAAPTVQPVAEPTPTQPVPEKPESTAKLRMRGLIVIIIVLLVGLAVGGAATYFYLNSDSSNSNTQTANSTPTPTATSSASPTPTSNPYAGWKTATLTVWSGGPELIFKYPAMLTAPSFVESDNCFTSASDDCPVQLLFQEKDSAQSLKGYYAQLHAIGEGDGSSEITTTNQEEVAVDGMAALKSVYVTSAGKEIVEYIVVVDTYTDSFRKADYARVIVFQDLVQGVVSKSEFDLVVRSLEEQ